jgi:hypothetical protein
VVTNNSSAPESAPNTLTSAEKAAGWKLLFDGKTTKGWHTFGKTTVGEYWKVQDGALYLDAAAKKELKALGQSKQS